ncbi:helix-turn-helix transcriptional regulator [Candidatus Dojkabacteria bacterium]|uniref:Helix-turn-helix transcriptional regulator n=1 Tax=Candidatus Dojkabacteria bacterium TaxID=2099670 RepID=A0A955HYM8_9BACT|nr:helix-turn-helix transcriptional regulator [Candidatus Dojkabacteria bacterium]MCB9790583.1 helix-turn-helix transcriptional regulator [Candidatus Nomurabacteria bacterium]
MLNGLGDRIKKYRERTGISQKKLGLALGLSDKAVSAYESGRTLPPLETLYRISSELKKPVRYFLTDEPELTEIDERLHTIETALYSIQEEIAGLKKKLNSK